jgi:hypothetical protein
MVYDTTDLIVRNYCELVKLTEAAKYWNILPATESNRLSFSA